MKTAVFCCIIFGLLLCQAPARAQETDAAHTHEDAPMTLEECASMWKKFMTKITDEDARTVCQCIEEEKTKHPLDAEKGGALSGTAGMDNAGPWPNIFNKCLIQGVPALKKPADAKAVND